MIVTVIDISIADSLYHIDIIEYDQLYTLLRYHIVLS